MIATTVRTCSCLYVWQEMLHRKYSKTVLGRHWESQGIGRYWETIIGPSNDATLDPKAHLSLTYDFVLRYATSTCVTNALSSAYQHRDVQNVLHWCYDRARIAVTPRTSRCLFFFCTSVYNDAGRTRRRSAMYFTGILFCYHCVVLSRVDDNERSHLTASG